MSELALAVHPDGEMSVDVAVVDEAVWIARARLGSIEDFDKIMTRYEGRLLRFLIGLVADNEIARELCQDTFLAAYQALPRVKGELRLSAWLHTIALNKARSHHRRMRFRKTLPLKDDILSAPGGNLQETSATGEIVQRTLTQIPTRYAEILLLQTVSGLSCREIALVVKCSEGAVKVRLMRARAAFKRVYTIEVGSR